MGDHCFSIIIAKKIKKSFKFNNLLEGFVVLSGLTLTLAMLTRLPIITLRRFLQWLQTSERRPIPLDESHGAEDEAIKDPQE